MLHGELVFLDRTILGRVDVRLRRLAECNAVVRRRRSGLAVVRAAPPSWVAALNLNGLDRAAAKPRIICQVATTRIVVLSSCPQLLHSVWYLTPYLYLGMSYSVGTAEHGLSVFTLVHIPHCCYASRRLAFTQEQNIDDLRRIGFGLVCLYTMIKGRRRPSRNATQP